MSLKLELIDLAVAIRTDDSDATGYFVAKDHHFTDFNRQIVEPGEDENFPDGALGIYVDDDYYAVAALPYKYKALSCAEIVASLWPEIENPTILPDHGDYWWTAQRDLSLEVPGEPWELWFVETETAIPNQIAMQVPHFTPEADENGRPVQQEEIRWRTCKTEQEALAARSKIGGTGYVEDFQNLGFEVRHWKDGVRTTVHVLPLDLDRFTLVDRPKNHEADIYKRLGLDGVTTK